MSVLRLSRHFSGSVDPRGFSSRFGPLGRRAGSQSYPAQIGSIELMLEFFDLSALTIDPSPNTIASVVDRSGKGRTVANLTKLAQPALGTAANGLPCAVFTAANSTVLAGTAGTAVEPRTVMVVGRSTDVSGAFAEGFVCIDKAVNVEPSPSMVLWATEPFTNPVKAGRTTVADAGSMNEFHVNGATRAFTFTVYTMRYLETAPLMELFIGKTTIATSTDSTATLPLRLCDGPITVGADFYNSIMGDYLTGEIQAVYIWSKKLSDTELLGMYAYLTGKGVV